MPVSNFLFANRLRLLIAPAVLLAFTIQCRPVKKVDPQQQPIRCREKALPRSVIPFSQSRDRVPNSDGAIGRFLLEDMAIEANSSSFQYVSDLVVPSPDGKSLLVGVRIVHHGVNALPTGMAVRLVDIETGKEIRKFKGHLIRQAVSGMSIPDPGETIIHVNALAFSPDGRTFLSGGDDRIVRSWDVETGNEIRTFNRHGEAVEAVFYSTDGCRALSIDRDGVAYWWDPETGRELRRFEIPSWVRKVVSTSAGVRILAVHQEKSLVLYDGYSGAPIQTFVGHTELIEDATISNDGRLIASCANDHTVRLWDVQTGKEAHRFSGETSFLNGLEFSLNGRFVIGVGAGFEDNFRLWETLTGRMIAAYTTPFDEHRSRPLNKAVFSLDGKFAFSDSEENVVLVWRLPTGQ